MCISKHGRKETRQHPQPPPPLPRPWPLSRVKSRLFGLQTFRVLSIAVPLNRLFSRPLFPFSMDKFQSQPRSSSNPVTASCDSDHPCPSPPSTSADWISLPSSCVPRIGPGYGKIWSVPAWQTPDQTHLFNYAPSANTHSHTHTRLTEYSIVVMWVNSGFRQSELESQLCH